VENKRNMKKDNKKSKNLAQKKNGDNIITIKINISTIQLNSTLEMANNYGITKPQKLIF
jgi:hypothetical protein